MLSNKHNKFRSYIQIIDKCFTYQLLQIKDVSHITNVRRISYHKCTTYILSLMYNLKDNILSLMYDLYPITNVRLK